MTDYIIYRARWHIFSRKKKRPLKSIFNRLLSGALMAVFGSWLVTFIRLNAVRELFSLGEDQSVYFILDLSGFILALFGLLTVLTLLPEMKQRLARIDMLGEREW